MAWGHLKLGKRITGSGKKICTVKIVLKAGVEKPTNLKTAFFKIIILNSLQAQTLTQMFYYLKFCMLHVCAQHKMNVLLWQVPFIPPMTIHTLYKWTETDFNNPERA